MSLEEVGGTAYLAKGTIEERRRRSAELVSIIEEKQEGVMFTLKETAQDTAVKDMQAQ